jgi:hypothetical protein
MDRDSARARPPDRPRPKPVERLIHARGHYPVWSVKSIAWLAILTIAVTATAVFLGGRRSLIVELEWTLGVVSAALFTLLAVGLYRGAKLRETEAPSADVKAPDMGDWTPDGTSLPDIDCPIDAVDGGDEGCLGAIAGFLLSVVVLMLLLGLLWVFLQFAVIVLFVVMTAIYWVLHLALRQVFAHSDDCRGKLARSLGFASLYTILYTGWLFALLLIASGLLGSRA